VKHEDEGSPPRAEHHQLAISRVSICLSIIALAVTALVSYINVFKPFHLVVWVSPVVQIQYKGNLGLYLHADFLNRSPKYGLVTSAAVVFYNTGSRENRYLLPLVSFRTLDEYGVYKYSLEELPVPLEPWEGKPKVMNFLYDAKAAQIQLVSGLYACELYTWADDGSRVRRVETYFEIEVTPEIVASYQENISINSSSLLNTYFVGLTPLGASKLSEEQYHAFRSLHNSRGPVPQVGP
jgi:hypothetical protein